jgi:RNA polymerase sigma-54 factor
MLKQTLSQKLLQKLSPQQIQFIKLLELNTLTFEQRVEEELIDNPALDTGKEEDYDSDEDLPKNEETEDFDSYDDDFDLSEYTSDDDGGIRLNDSYQSDEEREPIPISSFLSFREVLTEQLQSILRTSEEEVLAHQIIGTIDDDGYLRRPLKSIVNDLLFSSNIRTTEEELQRILVIIQQLDPPGIGARDLRECLLLQLEQKAKKKNTAIVKLAREILTDYMEDFSKKHYTRMLKRLDVSEDFLREAIEFITQLNPKPAGTANESRKTEYIIPDFIVQERYGELEVSLNGRNIPELRVSANYLETLKGFEQSKKPDKSAKEAVQFIKQKLDSAKWFVDSVKQRQNTLLVTMNAIVQYQKEYFLTGEETTLRPMILKDIADKVGLDISTISRVASSKYVETDFGIFVLKHFFSEGITTESGEEVSNKEVKMILKEAIESENKSKPLTDGKLMEILKVKGYPIARRTVAKYREQMNIPVARLRKEL